VRLAGGVIKQSSILLAGWEFHFCYKINKMTEEGADEKKSFRLFPKPTKK
jgi:hypothetical protein